MFEERILRLEVSEYMTLVLFREETSFHLPDCKPIPSTELLITL